MLTVPGDAAREHYLNWYDLDAQKLTAWHWRKDGKDDLGP